jgi:dUTP pyrophosphatase
MNVVSIGGLLPTRKNPTDAGLDLYSNRNIFLRPHEPVIIPTGIKVELPENTFGLLKPKSRHSFLIGGGVVDEAFRGEILVRVIPFEAGYVKVGDPIAQLIVLPVLYPRVEQVKSLSETPRGEDGGINRELEKKGPKKAATKKTKPEPKEE